MADVSPEDARPGLTRRSFLRHCSSAVLAIPLVTAVTHVAVAAPAELPGMDVRPRAAWAQGIPAPQSLPQERSEDVRFMIVHHSASPNNYGADDVPGVIRGFHSFHTGPDKGWPDVAYNFFIDRYGGVWEGRAGSLTRPVIPDATGGSQGFSQICCFIGDHTAEPPTDQARGAMTLLLAALAERYSIDPRPGVTTTFMSRGSNKWPVGSTVTTATIAGHRDMSQTNCPGDAAYPLVRDVFPVEVTAVLAARALPSQGETRPTAGPTVTSSETGNSGQANVSTSAPTLDATARAGDGEGVGVSRIGLVAAGVIAAGAAVGVAHHLRQRRAVHGLGDETQLPADARDFPNGNLDE